jgi:hypothetical protein
MVRFADLLPIAGSFGMKPSLVFCTFLANCRRLPRDGRYSIIHVSKIAKSHNIQWVVLDVR